MTCVKDGVGKMVCQRLCALHLSHESPSATQKHLSRDSPSATQKPAAGQRLPRAQQLLQEALRTAPATGPAADARSSSSQKALCSAPRGSGGHVCTVYCACHTKASRGPAAATRAAAPPGGSPAAATRAAAPPGGSVPHDSQPQASGGHARSLNPLAKHFTNPLT